MKFLSRFFGSPSGPSEPSVPEIDAVTARAWHENGDCVLVDIRENSEFLAEHISGSHLAPLSRFEQSLPRQGVAGKAVFLCRSGARTRSNAARLARCGFREAYILRGGIRAWSAAGFPTEAG